MAGHLRGSLGAAALVALIVLPAQAQAAPPVAESWLNSVAPTVEARPAPPVRGQRSRSRLGGRGLDDAHTAPLALVGLADPWPRRGHRIVAEPRR